MKEITIANCGGFWGDDPTALQRQIRGGPVDYLVMDFLAEVTMAVLNKQRARDPQRGYAGDFIAQLRGSLPEIIKRGATVISNAGGVNPRAAGEAVGKAAAELGLADRVRVGVVAGDDIQPRLDEIAAAGERLENMDTGDDFASIRERTLSANVYLGARPIAAALEMGANVVITGRTADAALVLAPLMHEFGWSPGDLDLLAAGMAAGHILECGLQATGGNFTDWYEVPSWKNMGFPIARVREDGTFAITKHRGTGGLVSAHTVAEQILYEIGSPAYPTPDVTVRFDSLTLTEAGPDRVEVAGVRGEPAPERLKASVSYRDGFRATGRFLIAGPDATSKALHVEKMFWEAAGGKELYAEAADWVLGRDGCVPYLGDWPSLSEVMLQVSVRDPDPDKIRERFSPRIAPLVLGSVPGITLLDPARPRPAEVIAHWPCLVSREAVSAEVTVGGEKVVVDCLADPVPGFEPRPVISQTAAFEGSWDRVPDLSVYALFPRSEVFVVEGMEEDEGDWDDEDWDDEDGDIGDSGADDGLMKTTLSRLCLARSGDKGDIANVGLIARSPEIYEWMVRELTPDAVKLQFAWLSEGKVERFEMPNLLALNFVLHRCLGGGGVRSLRMDPQGKTFAAYLLGSRVRAPRELVEPILKASAEAALKEWLHHKHRHEREERMRKGRPRRGRSRKGRSRKGRR